MDDIISTVKRDFIVDLVRQGKRADGRELNQLRDVTIELGPIKTANGSAKVKLGKTQVMVGVKLQTAVPFPDTPESGVLIVNAELLPMASPTFEPGPPREESVELARVVDRGVRESEIIDLEKLGITPGEKVWAVFIDIDVLDHDGGLIDASALAAVAALLNVKPPEVEDWKLQGFPVMNRPVAVTVAKIDEKLIVDPCLDEERVMDTRLTITTDGDGNIRAMQKGGIGYFTREELEQAYDIAREKASELRARLG